MSFTVLALTSGTVLADVTADEVWQSWQARLSDLGYEVTGSPERDGDRLVIRDLGLSQSLRDDGGRAELRIGRIAFEDRDDGTVAVIYPETMPMAVAVMPEEGKAVTATLTLSHDDLSVIASGTPDRIGYAYDAAALRLEIGDATVDGAPMEGLTGRMSLSDLSGTRESTLEAGMRRSVQRLVSGPMSYVLDVAPPDADSRLRLEGRAESLAAETGMTVPGDAGPEDMAAALNAGFAVEGRLAFGPGESLSVMTEEDETSRATSGSARSQLEMALSDNGLSAAFESEESVGRMEGGDLPFPVDYEAARVALRLALPVARDDAAQEFDLEIDLSEVSVSDDLWAMLDPDETLPRDPASLALGLSGRARLRADLFDEQAMAALEDGDRTGFEPERLVLETLLLEIAGATFTGAGAIDIDAGESDAMGLPAADGAIDLRLEGGNTLLDRLVAIGLLPQEQAMTARMMAAMFAQPVEGAEDTLTSRIEIAPSGSVTVNGERMR